MLTHRNDTLRRVVFIMPILEYTVSRSQNLCDYMRVHSSWNDTVTNFCPHLWGKFITERESETLAGYGRIDLLRHTFTFSKTELNYSDAIRAALHSDNPIAQTEVAVILMREKFLQSKELVYQDRFPDIPKEKRVFRMLQSPPDDHRPTHKGSRRIVHSVAGFNSAIHVALVSGSVEVVKVLHELGFDFSSASPYENACGIEDWENKIKFYASLGLKPTSDEIRRIGYNYDSRTFLAELAKLGLI